MASANLNTNKKTVGYNTVTTGFTFTALDGTDGGYYTVTNTDSKMVVIVNNTDSTNAENVTIKAPTTPVLGTDTGNKDKTVSVAKSEMGVIVVESARYMNQDGKVYITGSADVTVQVLEIV